MASHDNVAVVVNEERFSIQLDANTNDELYKMLASLFGRAPRDFDLFHGETKLNKLHDPLPDGDLTFFLVERGQLTQKWDGGIGCECALQDLQQLHDQCQLPKAILLHLDEVPLASNYIIENAFRDRKIIGSVIEECSGFSPSQTTLRRHLDLLDVTKHCALLVSPSWLV